MNLMPMNYGGTKQVAQIWGNIMSQIPQMIREDKKFQIEMQKVGDIEKVNDTAFTQLKAICSEVGIDPGIIPSPIQGQNPEEYITKGIQTFMNTAQNQDVDPKSVVDSLGKLSGGGAIEEVRGAQEHVSQKTSSMEAMLGGRKGRTAIPGAEPEDPAQYRDITEKDIMDTLSQDPSPYELPPEEGGVGGTLNQLIAEKEQGGEQIPSVSQMIDPELRKDLQLLPRMKRRQALQKYFNPEEKYYEKDLLKDITDYVNGQTKLREAKEKAGLVHKRGLEKQKEQIEITAKEARETDKWEKYLGMLEGDIEVYDMQGNPVKGINLEEASKGNYLIGKKRPSESVSRGFYSRSGAAKEGSENVKLLKIYKDDSAKAMTSLQNIEKYLQDPKSAAGRMIAKEEGIKSTEDAQTRQEELRKVIGDNTYKAQQIEQRLQIEQQPGEGEEEDPTAKMSPEDKQAYEWATANSSDARSAQILDKLRTKYGF